MIRMFQAVYDQLRVEAAAAYPMEGCGVLLGCVRKGERLAERAISLRNVSSVPRNRYEIDLLELVRVEREARQAGLEILGFYHSHPDHPAMPSSTDLAEAHWIGSSYVITAVVKGEAAETRSFFLAGSREEDKSFVEEEIQVFGEQI